ncbi:MULTISPECIES: MerR family transcriptional regulator [unclassified Novosphingobium]|uniref:MerR family transcriptional regulator n=1 Tax=unclassified Novosphingobium TaxID=2644732 RepID=UPI00146F1F55|nr:MULTISPECIES: MerR family transcriptional regulator [unclassified Novosphingobium]NMN03632.1 DNA-binding transcriptional MerR regulator [Novosphingobium sp. SG919]NMN86378.1 DNA-binding transcriptional MerR regulator [Novosphingobium sp. SG916]
MTDKGHLVSPDGVIDDGKAPDALRTIGEVARILGVKPHVLRYWEEQFPMLRPLTRAGNRRYYRAQDVALVATIDRLLNREGYTIRGARQALESGLRPDAAPPVSVPAPSTAVTQAAPAPQAAAHPAAAGAPALETELVAAIARLRVHLERIRSGLAVALDES